jgi:hypothetical protein
MASRNEYITEFLRQIGGKGGRSRSAEKVEASRRNMAKAREAKLKKKGNGCESV